MGETTETESLQNNLEDLKMNNPTASGGVSNSLLAIYDILERCLSAPRVRSISLKIIKLFS